MPGGVSACQADGVLVIPTVATMAEGLDASRYQLLAKLQLTESGKGRHPGPLRNYLAAANCDAADIKVLVPGYLSTWGLYLDAYQVYARLVLLDYVTGYRSQYQEDAFVIKAI